jgi:glycogen operon protein
MMIAFRKKHPLLRKSTFFRGTAAFGIVRPDLSWHGIDPDHPDWAHNSHSIACLLTGAYGVPEIGKEDTDIYLAFNASLYSLTFRLPPAPSGLQWRLVVDTSLPTPYDIVCERDAKPLSGLAYRVQRLSMVVLIS